MKNEICPSCGKIMKIAEEAETISVALEGVEIMSFKVPKEKRVYYCDDLACCISIVSDK